VGGLYGVDFGFGVVWFDRCRRPEGRVGRDMVLVSACATVVLSWCMAIRPARAQAGLQNKGLQAARKPQGRSKIRKAKEKGRQQNGLSQTAPTRLLKPPASTATKNPPSPVPKRSAPTFPIRHPKTHISYLLSASVHTRVGTPQSLHANHHPNPRPPTNRYTAASGHATGVGMHYAYQEILAALESIQAEYPSPWWCSSSVKSIGA